MCSASMMSAQQAVDPARDSVEHVRGVVLNSLDGKPVARALVTSPDQKMAAMTDDRGRFSFDVHRALPYASNGDAGLRIQPMRSAQGQAFNLTVRRPDYLPSSPMVRLAADPRTASEEIEVRIVPESVLHGLLSASGGEQTAGVQVQIFRKQVQDGAAAWVPAGGVMTNAHGEYRLAELRAGEYKLKTQAWAEGGFDVPQTIKEVSGYAPSFSGDAADLGSEQAIHVGAGQTVEADLNLHPATFYRVSVPVANAPEKQGVNVSVGDGNDSLGLQLGYSSQAKMISGFLPNGAYDVRVTSYGQPGSSGRSKVQVTGEAVKGVPVVLTPNGEIPVVVRHEYTAVKDDSLASGSARNAVSRTNPVGLKIPRHTVDVSLQVIGSNMRIGELKEAPGRGDDGLMLANVQEGKYAVQAQASSGYIASLSSDGVDLLRQPLVVGTGGTSAPIEVTVRDDGATVSGRIAGTLPAGQLLDKFAFIVCIPLDRSLSGHIQQAYSMDGRFAMQNVAPGRYVVVAFDGSPMSLEYRNEDVLRELQSRGTVVTVAAGQKVEVEAPLLPASGDEQ